MAAVLPGPQTGGLLEESAEVAGIRILQSTRQEAHGNARADRGAFGELQAADKEVGGNQAHLAGIDLEHRKLRVGLIGGLFTEKR